MSIVSIILVLAIVIAVVARLRLWYYARRDRIQTDAEFAIQARRDALAADCERLFWEGQR